MGRGKREQVRDGGEAQATGATSDEDSDHGSARCVRGGGVFFRRVSGGCVGLLRVLLFVGKEARVVERGVKGMILGDGSRVERIIRTGFGL